MPRVRQRRHERRRLTWDEMLQLATGMSFGQTPWGGNDLLPDERHKWPDAATRADMETAWQANRELILAEYADMRPTWGELFFEQSMTADEARDKHNWEWRERNGFKHYDPSRPGKLIGE